MDADQAEKFDVEPIAFRDPAPVQARSKALRTVSPPTFRKPKKKSVWNVSIFAGSGGAILTWLIVRLIIRGGFALYQASRNPPSKIVIPDYSLHVAPQPVPEIPEPKMWAPPHFDPPPTPNMTTAMPDLTPLQPQIKMPVVASPPLSPRQNQTIKTPSLPTPQKPREKTPPAGGGLTRDEVPVRASGVDRYALHQPRIITSSFAGPESRGWTTATVDGVAGKFEIACRVSTGNSDLIQTQTTKPFGTIENGVAYFNHASPVDETIDGIVFKRVSADSLNDHHETLLTVWAARDGDVEVLMTVQAAKSDRASYSALMKIARSLRQLHGQ